MGARDMAEGSIWGAGICGDSDLQGLSLETVDAPCRHPAVVFIQSSLRAGAEFSCPRRGLLLLFPASRRNPDVIRRTRLSQLFYLYLFELPDHCVLRIVLCSVRWTRLVLGALRSSAAHCFY